MLYIISYDLNKPGQNYPELYKAIKTCGSWSHRLDSTWLVDSNLYAQSISDRITPHIDKNDYLLVFRLSKDHQGQLPQKTWDWINKHV